MSDHDWDDPMMQASGAIERSRPELSERHRAALLNERIMWWAMHMPDLTVEQILRVISLTYGGQAHRRRRRDDT